MRNKWNKEKTYIVVNTSPAISGYFAHIINWYEAESENDVGMWDITDTGIGRYNNRADAVINAKILAEELNAIYVEASNVSN